MNYIICGCGRAGASHASILIEQGQKIVALVDDVPATFDTFCELVPSTKDLPRFSSPEELLEAGIKFDIAVVASHTDLHAKHTLPFVRKGIPVYTEKPITSNLQDAFRFVQSYREATTTTTTSGPVPVLIGLQRHFDEPLCYGKSIVDSGKLGTIREIRIVLKDQFPPPPSYQGSMHSQVPIISDMSVHVIDEAMMMTGETFESVWCRTFRHKAYTSHLDEGGNAAHMGAVTPSGVVVQIDTSRTHAAGYNNSCEIVLTGGVVHVGRYQGYNIKDVGTPVPVDVYLPDGTKDEGLSRQFMMPYITPPYAEFVPRFKNAFQNAHVEFRRMVEQAAASGAKTTATTGRGVTPGVFPCLDVLVAIDAFCVSALADGKTVAVSRDDDIQKYWEICRSAGFVKGDF